MWLTIGHLMEFDCDNQYINIATASFSGTGDCDFQMKNIKIQDAYIQFLQLSDFEFIPYIQCQISISRTSSSCGMHSHISTVHNGYVEYLRSVPYQQYERIHRDGVFSLLNGNTINSLEENSVITHNILPVSINNDVSCEGAKYSDSYGNWSISGFVSVNTDRVTLNSETLYTLSKGYCLDMEYSYIFWQAIPSAICIFKQYKYCVENLDIFTYVNSKFVHVEKHISTQVTEIHKDIMTKTYELKKQVITNVLAFACTQTEEFACILMKASRYMVVTAGYSRYKMWYYCGSYIETYTRVLLRASYCF